MSVSTNITGQYADTITNCTKALAIDKSAIKALYRRSIAYMKIHEFEQGTEDINTAIKLAPNDSDLLAHSELLKKEHQEWAIVYESHISKELEAAGLKKVKRAKGGDIMKKYFMDLL